MEVQNNDSTGVLSQNTRREAQIRNEDHSAVEVPEIGQDSLNRVTKLPEAYDLSGTLSNKTLRTLHVNSQEKLQKVSITSMMQESIALENLIGRQ